MTTLRNLYDAHNGKLSDRWALYLETYERLLSPWRSRDLRMLEIGIQNGGSLEIWSKYFPQACCLIGCDIDPKCELLHYEDPRVKVVVGDVNTDDAQAKIQRISPALDLIVDDGSHTSSDIIRSFARYFPMVADGGLFIAEDLHCSYWADFEGGLFDLTSSIAFFKALADIVNFEHWGRPYQRADLLTRFRERWGCSLEEDELARVHSVEFVNSICIVRKAGHAQNVLGPRIIARGKELVAAGHPELAGAPVARFDQGANPRAQLDAEPSGLIERQGRQLKSQAQRIQELESALQTSHRQLSDATNVIQAMRESRCWRYTRWFRELSTIVRPTSNG